MVRRLLTYIDRLAFAGVVFFLLWSVLPIREARIQGLGLLSAFVAYAFYQARTDAGRIYLRTRPGGRRFESATWIAPLVIALAACGVIWSFRVLELDWRMYRLVWPSRPAGEMADLALRSWHWTLVPFAVAIAFGFRLIAGGRWYWGIPVAVLASFIPSVPYHPFNGKGEETFLWQILGRNGWTLLGFLVAAPILLRSSYPIVRPIVREWVHRPGDIVRWLVGADPGQPLPYWGMAAVIPIAIVWPFYVVPPASAWTCLVGLSAWALIQFALSLAAVRSATFFVTRPSREGRGGLGGIRALMMGGWRRVVGAALFAGVLFAIQDIGPGLSIGLAAARAGVLVAAVSAGYLALLVTWWAVVREGERPLVPAGVFVITAGLPAAWCETYGGLSAMSLCLLLAVANVTLLVVWRIASRQLPGTLSVRWRLSWVAALLIPSGIYGVCMAADGCLAAFDFLWYAATRGGYLLSVWIMLIAMGAALAYQEARGTYRSRRMLFGALAVSLIVPFLGLLILDLTRPRQSWLRSRWYPGLLPKLLIPFALCTILIGVRGGVWIEGMASEAYMASPRRAWSPAWRPGREPLAWIEVVPAPDRVLLNGQEIPNPWRLSQREALERLEPFWASVRKKGRYGFDTFAFRDAVSYEGGPEPVGGYGLWLKAYYPAAHGYVSSVGGSAYTLLENRINRLLHSNERDRAREALDRIAAVLEGAPSDGAAVDELYRVFGRNTPYYVHAFLGEPLERIDYSPLGIGPHTTRSRALVSRCRRLVPLVARREGVELPPVTDPWSYGRLARGAWERQTGVWEGVLAWTFRGEIGESPAPVLGAVVDSLETAYVAGVRPPYEIVWALRQLEYSNAREDCEALFALVAACYGWWSTPRRPADDHYVQQYEELLRFATAEQKRRAVDVLASNRLSPLMPLLGASGDERVRSSIEDALSNTQSEWHQRALLAALEWPDASILDTVESVWPKLLDDQGRGRLYRRRFGERLRAFLDRLRDRWPADPRPTEWRREVEERFPPAETEE